MPANACSNFSVIPLTSFESPPAQSHCVPPHLSPLNWTLGSLLPPVCPFKSHFFSTTSVHRCLLLHLLSHSLLSFTTFLSGSTDPQEQEPFTMCVCMCGRSVPTGQTGSDGRRGKQLSIIRSYRRHRDTRGKTRAEKQ